jgi:hypothetical protein
MPHLKRRERLLLDTVADYSKDEWTAASAASSCSAGQTSVARDSITKERLVGPLVAMLRGDRRLLRVDSAFSLGRKKLTASGLPDPPLARGSSPHLATKAEVLM